ncbi:MAG: hypothetical protein LBI19_03540, partial [Oscillospiraceae bacterium]|nr:hypothetical protein [Oscillospiraceae bacterium]
TIDRREIDAMVQKASLFMSDYSERDAENFIIRRETLYAVALSEGYAVSDEEANEYIQLQIDMSSKADNLDNFNEYLAGYGMSLEEYWKSQSETLRKELLYSKYLNDQRERIIKQSGEPDDEEWNAEMRRIEEEARAAFVIEFR